MSPPSRLVLVRHGETTGQSSVRLFGATDIPLSELGRRQALRVRAALAGVVPARLVVTPLARAREFAALAFPGCEPRVVEGLREVDFGRWEGLTWEEAEARDPELVARARLGEPDFTYPGGDQRAAFRARIAATAREVFAPAGPGPVAAVLHKGVIKAVLAALVGACPEGYRHHPVHLGSIHRLVHDGTAWTLASANETGHLGEDHLAD